MKEMLGLFEVQSHTHHQTSDSKSLRRGKHIKQLMEVLRQTNTFNVNELDDCSEFKLFNLATKTVMPETVQDDILPSEARCESAFRTFVSERIYGYVNLWDKMSKVKFAGWVAGCKSVQLKVGSNDIILEASNYLCACLFAIAQSVRDEVGPRMQ